MGAESLIPSAAIVRVITQDLEVPRTARHSYTTYRKRIKLCGDFNHAAGKTE